jgi:outer membrane immunogenic protein
MKKSLVSILAVAMATASAAAADLPSRKAPPPIVPVTPPPLWTGFYLGVNAGYAFSGSKDVDVGIYRITSLAMAPPTGLSVASAIGAGGQYSVGADGFIGGGQIGYNWQFSGNWVVGVEADIQGVAGGSQKTTSSNAFKPAPPQFQMIATTVSATRSLDYLGTVRGRIGYLVTPTLLVFGSGGLAYGGAGSNLGIFQAVATGMPVNPGFGSTGGYSTTRVGWSAGGGLEWLFLPKWSAKVEYLYYDLGSFTYPGSWLGATHTFDRSALFINGVSATTRFDGHVVRVGLNYHIDWGTPAPVVAKY